MEDFDKGVFYAAAMLVRLYGRESTAAGILREAGLNRADITLLDDFEKEALLKLNSEGSRMALYCTADSK